MVLPVILVDIPVFLTPNHHSLKCLKCFSSWIMRPPPKKVPPLACRWSSWRRSWLRRDLTRRSWRTGVCCWSDRTRRWRRSCRSWRSRWRPAPRPPSPPSRARSATWRNNWTSRPGMSIPSHCHHSHVEIYLWSFESLFRILSTINTGQTSSFNYNTTSIYNVWKR